MDETQELEDCSEDARTTNPRPHILKTATGRSLPYISKKKNRAYFFQLKATFDAQPALAQRFPGGIIQFAQAAGQMPEKVLDDIIIVNIGNEHKQNRVMPREMPSQQVGVFANTSDGEDDNIDDGGPERVIVLELEQEH